MAAGAELAGRASPSRGSLAKGSSRLRHQLSAVDEQLWDKSHGTLIDYLHRGHINEQTFHCQMLPLVTAADNFVGLDRAPQGVTAYSSGIQAFYRELVSASLLEVVTRYCKSQGRAEWSVPDGLIQKRAEEIMMMKRRAIVLKAEMTLFLKQYHLYVGLRCGLESQEQRIDRLGEFWQRFHDMGRPTRPAPRGDTSDPSPRRGAGSPRSPTAGGMLQTRSAGAAVALKVPSSTGAALWETRAYRSHCSFGTWDWAPEASAVMSRSYSTPVLCGSTLLPPSSPSSPTTSTRPGFRLPLSPGATSTVSLPPIGQSLSRSEAEVGATMLSSTSRSMPVSMCTLRRSGLAVSEEDGEAPSLSPSRKAIRLQRFWKAEHGLTLRPGSSELLPRGGDATRGSRMQHSSRSMTSLGGGLPPGPGRRSLIEEAKAVRPPNRSSASQPKPATDKYLSACQKTGIVPTPFAFTTGHTKVIDGKNKALLDLDLAALMCVVKATGIESVDLEGNCQLTDVALAKFVDSIVDQPKGTGLQLLSLKGCSRASMGTVKSIRRLLQEDSSNWALSRLDVSGIPMNVQIHTALCQAIGTHPFLKDVSLANTGFGQLSPKVNQCLDALFVSDSLETLNLSWSCFNGEAFCHLGELVVASKSLTSLNVSNCSTAVEKKPLDLSPAALLLEALGRDTTLTHLDVSLNRMDFRAALTAEMAFQKNKNLMQLDLTNNPLGVLGMRSMLRLLANDKCGLLHFKASGCSVGAGSSDITDSQIYSITKPEGRYSLDLAKPYHRALLRALYVACERFGMSIQDAFTDVLAQPAFEHPKAEPNGHRALPMQGKLFFTFSTEKTYERMFHGPDVRTAGAFVQLRTKVARLQPSFKKVRPLLALFRSHEGIEHEQIVLLEALAKDFYLPYAVIEQLCQSRSMTADIVGRLLPCVSGGLAAWHLTENLCLSLPDFIRVCRQVHNIFLWNPENPSGRYHLDLGKAADHTVAEHLAWLDEWEMTLSGKAERPDVSERGNRSQVRNVAYNKQPILPAKAPDRQVAFPEWLMPDVGIVDLDYSSSLRPSAGTAALDAATWSQLLTLTSRNICQDTPLKVDVLALEGRLQALRQISHHVCITSLQLRELLSLFKSEAARAEVAVIFFNRVVDMQHEKLFRSRFEKAKDIEVLRERLGYAVFFPFVQPEGCSFTLDMRKYDQRVAVSLLTQLGYKENIRNFRNPSLVRLDGTTDPMLLGLPRAWDNAAKIPEDTGILSVHYECAAAERALPMRLQFLGSYGGWPNDLGEDHPVSWCSSWCNLSAPVQELVEFVAAKFETSEQAFAVMLGEKEVPEITYKEFDEKFRRLKCTRFEGTTESTTINDIFKFLDALGEEKVTRDAWKARVQPLLEDVRLYVSEFVRFCDGVWPPAAQDSMATAFRGLAIEGRASIARQDWAGLLQDARYFGPASPIFSLADKEQRGVIDAEAFDGLARFRAAKQLA